MSLQMFQGPVGVPALFLALFVVASTLVLLLNRNKTRIALKREWDEADAEAEKIRRARIDAAFRAGWRF